ncbi:MAG TPA: hypothetical protein VL947_04930, partial [Cytophagales bacterium]|nr:hypothetical protein [Cytophagales bacterium]
MKYSLFIFLLLWCASMYGKPVSESEWQEEKKDFVYSKVKEEEEPPSKRSSSLGDGEHSSTSPSPNFKFPVLNNMSVLYGFIIIVVLVVLALLLKNITLPQKLIQTDLKQDEALVEERLMETDIDRLIRQALERNNYQLAIRYTFLKTLKTLVVKNKLIWKKQYTNRDYLVQLYNTPYFEAFQNITRIYERKWYRNDLSSKDEYE